MTGRRWLIETLVVLTVVSGFLYSAFILAGGR
jgi:hypothetical protein